MNQSSPSHLLFALLPFLVIAWTVWAAIEYRRLKRALLQGRREALIREYRLTIAGELLFGVLSLLAVGSGLFRPAPAFRVVLPPGADGAVYGVLVGVGVSLLLGPWIARRTGRPVIVGDVAALLPQTPPERRLFAAVAVSAGVCEELLFRGYGMRLFVHAGLTGWVLLLVAALAFGLAHVYQGILGVVGTFAVGLVLCLAYVTTGSLLVPIALHTLIDLRALTLAGATPPERLSQKSTQPWP